MIKEVPVTKQVITCDVCEELCEETCGICRKDLCCNCASTVYLEFFFNSMSVSVCPSCEAIARKFMEDHSKDYEELNRLRKIREKITDRLYAKFCEITSVKNELL